VGHVLTEARIEGTLRGHLFPFFSPSLARDAVLIGGFCLCFGLDGVELGGLQQGDQRKLSSPLLGVGKDTAGNIWSRSRGKRCLGHVLQGETGRAELV